MHTVTVSWYFFPVLIADYVGLFSFIGLSFLLYPYSNLDHFIES